MLDKIRREKISNWLDTNNFCAMPFFHIAIESNGDVRPCCLGDVLTHEDGSNFNSAGMSIQEVINHPTHKKFRESFKKNQQHPACHVCWGDYQTDRFSGRYVYSAGPKVSDEVEKIVDGQSPEQKLLWLEIKAGNRCNLSCRICGLWNSSKWLKETYNFRKSQNSNYPEFKQSNEFFYNKQSKWIDDVSFWKNIEGFDDIRIIHLMGGEPLLIDEHFEMLSAIIKKFDASKIAIWYNTNGTILPSKEHEEILLKFKRIFWSVSIDDFGKRFDYQRKGADWNSVKDNLKYFVSKENYRMSIDTTISIFNVFTINEFVKELEKMKLSQFFGPHYVTSPRGIYNIRGLDISTKEIIKKQLLANKFNIDENYQHKTDEIINFMMAVDEWSEKVDQNRKEHIDFIDQQRKESFVEVFPEMAKLLNYV
jgi:MoaA/NifB/PqqE/SkfB family radical SAM enzyme